MRLSDVIRVMEQLAPPSLQEAYDNSGLQCGDPGMNVTGILLTLDCTEEVLEEARRNKCNLVISHHPVLFKAVKSISGKTAPERIIRTAIKRDIAIYSCHTNLDNVIHGVNGRIADKLGLQKRRVLAPIQDQLLKLVTFCPVKHSEKVRNALFHGGAGVIGNYSECSFTTTGTGTFKGSESTDPFVGKKGMRHRENEERIEVILPKWKQSDVLESLLRAHPYEEVAYDFYPMANRWNHIGSGLVGELPRSVPEEKFLEGIRMIFGTGVIRHSPLRGKAVRRVALCGGAGAFLIPKALQEKADVFITGDVKYHDFFLGEGKFLIADVGHAESEQFTPEIFYDALRKKFPKFALRFSKIPVNPVNYF